jgi:hypothetical protein
MADVVASAVIVDVEPAPVGPDERDFTGIIVRVRRERPAVRLGLDRMRVDPAVAAAGVAVAAEGYQVGGHVDPRSFVSAAPASSAMVNVVRRTSIYHQKPLLHFEPDIRHIDQNNPKRQPTNGWHPQKQNQLYRVPSMQ